MPDEHKTAVDDSHLQGLRVEASDPQRLREAIEWAFTYRGDVTVARRSTGASVEGFVFDRRDGGSEESLTIRMMPKDGSPRVTIPIQDIASVQFTGKDAAAGKSFETWINKYVQKKLAGKAANIEPEPMEET